MTTDLSKTLIQSFTEVYKKKGISRLEIAEIIENCFRNAIDRKYGNDKNFEIIINPERGEIQILHIREVIPANELTNPNEEISLEEAQKLDPSIELYEEYAQEIPLSSFDRRAVNQAKQDIKYRLQEIEFSHIYNRYQERIGEVILGEVYQVRSNKDVLINHNRIEMVLPANEQIYKDRYKRGDMVRAMIKEVRPKGHNSQIIVSRTAPLFLSRLFEAEIPEVFDGIIEIKKIVREPGERSKVVVFSHDQRIDPVGACIGMKGVRIHGIVRELRNENIDVITYSDNIVELIKKALQPVEVQHVTINEKEKKAEVIVPVDGIAQAIGKKGVNIKLASQLTGYNIDIYREPEEEDDIHINEFTEDFGKDIIDILHSIGCDTARSVLDINKEELVERTQGKLTVEQASKIIETISFEFDEEKKN